MKPRTDEEIAASVDATLSGERGHFISTCTTERDRRMVAAGRAEGDKQGERRGWVEALTWATTIPFDGKMRDAMRARLREVEGEK